MRGETQASHRLLQPFCVPPQPIAPAGAGARCYSKNPFAGNSARLDNVDFKDYRPQALLGIQGKAVRDWG